MDNLAKGATRERVDFSRIKTSIPIPNLIEVQKKSYEQRPQQRRQAKPGKDRVPGRHRSGERERQFQQAGGNDRGCPRLRLRRNCRAHTTASVKHSPVACYSLWRVGRR